MKILTSITGSLPASNLEEAINMQLELKSNLKDDKEKLSLDVVTDGQTSGGMIEIFASKIPGIRKSNEKYEIHGGLAWPGRGITVRDQKLAKGYLARQKSQALLKGIITGPYTLAKACTDNYYENEKEVAQAFAAILNSELKELQTVVDVLQIDEPAFYYGVPDYASQMFSTLVGGVNKEIILHTHANKNPDLYSEVRKVAGLPVQVLSYDSAAVPQVLNAIAKCAPAKQVSLGCIRTDVSYVPGVGAIANRIRNAVSRLGPGKIKYVTPDCGLRIKTQSNANEMMRRVVAARNRLSSS